MAHYKLFQGRFVPPPPAILLTLLLLALFPLFIFQVSSHLTVATAKTAAADGQADAETQHTLAATYYQLTKDINATLMLSNQGPYPKLIQLTLFGGTGEPFSPPPFILSGQEVRALALRDYVSPGSVFEEGHLQVTYTGKSMELGGVLQLVDESHSLMFDEELLEPATAFTSTQRRSLVVALRRHYHDAYALQFI